MPIHGIALHPRRSLVALLPIVVAGLALDAGPASAQAAPHADAAADSVAAVEAARDWLALLDEDRTTEAYERAAPLLRRIAGSAEAWAGFTAQPLAAMPETPERELVLYDADPDLPGAPPGDYRMMTFRMTNAEGVTETVYVLATGEGWKVAMWGVRGL